MNKATRNRKAVSGSESITHAGFKYTINNKPTQGVYLSLLHKSIAQLDVCLEIWGRVLVVRFDLRQSIYSDNSELITRFRKNSADRINRKYGLTKLGYVWAREQEKAKKQHYHWALFLDGDMVRHPSAVLLIIRETWERLRDGNSVWTPRSCFYFIDDDNSKAQAVYRISYLAKARGKGYRPLQAKDYSTSRLVARRSFSATTQAEVGKVPR